FSDIKPFQARLICFALVIVVLFGLIFCDNSSPPYQENKSIAVRDADTFHTITERVHAGQNYYEVVADELRTRGYGLRPFFNFRLPTLVCFIGKMPSLEVPRWLLVSISVLTLLIWIKILDNKGGFYMAASGSLLLLVTTVFSYTAVAFVFHEIWAGVLVALSIAIHRQNRWLSVILGLTALFIRELSLPFVAIMLIMAYKDKNIKEALAWLIGIIAFFIYLAIHAKIVSGLVTDSDIISKTWLQFGGWQFVLSTSKFTLPTIFSPWWIDAVLLPLAILGLFGWRGDFGTRSFLTMGIYILAFLIAGRPDNYYWGLMYTPFMPFGLVHAPLCLLDLFKSCFRKAA
ncbi:MAG: glycosyltransferase family protein, partial [Planctomycetota bacterium]